MLFTHPVKRFPLWHEFRHFFLYTKSLAWNTIQSQLNRTIEDIYFSAQRYKCVRPEHTYHHIYKTHARTHTHAHVYASSAYFDFGVQTNGVVDHFKSQRILSRHFSNSQFSFFFLKLIVYAFTYFVPLSFCGHAFWMVVLQFRFIIPSNRTVVVFLWYILFYGRICIVVLWLENIE